MHKACTVSRGFSRIEIWSVENGNAMIDWARLVQREMKNASERHKLSAGMTEKQH